MPTLPDVSAQLTALNGWDVLWAVLCGLAGWIASIFAYKAARAGLVKLPNVSETMATIGARIVRYLLILLGVGIGLGFLGIGLQPVIAITIIVVAVLALAMRGIADNFASGVVLQSRNTVKVGDEIDVDGLIGTITEMNGRAILLRTRDGRIVHVPNSQLLSNPVVNHSEDHARRSTIEVRLKREGRAVDDLLELLESAIAPVPGVSSGTPVRALARTISPERLVAHVQFWHRPTKGVGIRSDVVRRLAETLDEEGVHGTVTSDLPDTPLTAPDAV